MRRPNFLPKREASRRPANPRSGISNNNNGGTTSTAAASASVSAWVHPRLLDATTLLLTLQPDAPLLALRQRFTIEALLLTSLPETNATMEEEEEEAEKENPTASLRSSPVPAGAGAKAGAASAMKGKSLSSSNDRRAGATASSAPPPHVAESLLEHSWARRRLQPYGLHAVARSVCSMPHTPATDPSVSQASRATQLQLQWLECFALLHRQSRLSAPERLAATRAASQVHGAALPPVDYRAAEELPVSLALLYAMCVMEGHTRRADGAAASAEDASAAAATFALRRSQLSLQLMGLQLFAAAMQRQEREMSVSSSCSDEHGATEAAPSLLVHLLRLPPRLLTQFHRWLTQRLRGVVVVGPAKAIARGVDTVSREDSTGASVPSATTDLLALQSRVLNVLSCIFRGDGTGSTAVLSVDAFVAVMQRVAVLVAAHQSTATSMALTLSERAGKDAARLRWVTSRLQSCTVHVLNAEPRHEEAASAPPLPPVWRMYVEHIVDALAVFHADASCADGHSKLALTKLLEASALATDACVLTFEEAFKEVRPSVLVAAMVQDWLARLFESHILMECGAM